MPFFWGDGDSRGREDTHSNVQIWSCPVRGLFLPPGSKMKTKQGYCCQVKEEGVPGSQGPSYGTNKDLCSVFV